MNSEERFKKSLDELLRSKEFSFDETDWEKARDMIDASKKAKRRMAPLILAGALLFISLLTGFYFLVDLKSEAAEKRALNTVKPAADVSPVIAESEIHASTATSQMKPALHFKKPASKDLPKALSFTKVLSGAEIKTSLNSTILIPGKMASAVIETEHVKHENGNTPTIPATVKSAPEETPPAIPGINNPEKENSSPVVHSSAADLAVISTGKEKEEQPAKIDKGEHLASDEPLSLETFLANEPVKNEIPAPEIHTVENTTAAVPRAADTTTAPIENENVITAPAIAVMDSAKSNAGREEQETILTDNGQGEIGKPKELPVLFSVEAGASYLYGWQNPGTRDANGFNPLIGINYFNNFKPKMSFSFGLHYSTVSNLSYSSYTSRVTSRGLGEESQVTVFTPSKIHYLIVPLRFNYAVNPMNTIGIGCNVAYLLTVESDVESYTQKLNSIDNYSLTKAKGYTQGFKKYDTQVSVFYKRRLYPNLAVNVEMFFGLTDIKDNSFFNSNVFERNSGLKLTLVYNILKK